MTIAAAVLAALGVAFGFIGAVGTLAMRDAYQRLHYLAPAALAPFFLAAALFCGEHDKQPAVKMLMAAVLINVTNGAVSHATARAQRIRDGKPFGSLAPDERAAGGAP